MNPGQWDDFLLVYKGNVDQALAGYIQWADNHIAALTGVVPPEGPPDVPLVAEAANLSEVTLAVLRAEMARLEIQISADADKAEPRLAAFGGHIFEQGFHAQHRR